MHGKFKSAIKINKREDGDKTFFYFDFGIDSKKSVRVWINREMAELIVEKYGELYLEFPLTGCEIIKGKRDLILRKGTKNLFFIEAEQSDKDSLRIEKIKTYPSNNYSIIAQKVVLDAAKSILIMTEDKELILDWTYIYWKRNKKKEKIGIFKIDTDNTLLLEDISIELLEDLIKEIE
jgi:hypothetical protein